MDNELERYFEIVSELVIWAVVVPAVLWGIIVAAGAVAGRWRTFTFVLAVLVGGFGLVFGIFGLTFDISDDRGDNLLGGPIFVAAMYVLGGIALLSLGALIGFVALFLRQRPWGQPSSGDSVGSGHGDQGSDV